MKCGVVLILLSAVASIGLSVAGCSSSSPPSERPNLGEIPDAAFLKNVATSSQMEIELSRAALTRSEDPRVKEFAQKMITDHSRMNQELRSFASARGLEISGRLGDYDQTVVKQLSDLSGKSFDSQYVARMVKDHQKAVDDFKDQTRSAADPDVRRFASRTLPTLEDHLQMARELKSQVGGG